MAKGDSGFNATLAIRGYGSRRVRAIVIDFGLAILASSDNEARSRKAFYPKTIVGSTFDMKIAFVSWAEREAFNTWIHRFMVNVSEGSASSPYVTTTVPSRDFVRTSVLLGPLEYGEGMGDLTYLVHLNFVGVTDPVNADLGARMAGVTYFKWPANNRVSRYFYPKGVQKSGAANLDGTLYDANPAAAYVPSNALNPINPGTSTVTSVSPNNR